MVSAVALLLSPVLLPDAIELWRRDLEREFGASVPVVWSGTRLEGDAGAVEFASRQLESAAFRQQFRMMQAATITEQTGGAPRSLVLVNEAWRHFWEGHEAALLGHELGHVWLRLRRLPAPAYSGGAMGCLAVHAGDVVQHVLIRAEMDRRRIEHRALLMKHLDAAASSMESADAAQDDCSWARQAALWTDARLALAEAAWPGRQRYESAANRRFPEVAPRVMRIVSSLQGSDLNDRFTHRQALVEAHAILRELATEQRKHRSPSKTRYPDP